jgi:hypothetical protein
MRYEKLKTGDVSSAQVGQTLLACESRCAGGGKSTPAADENSRSSAFLINGPRLEINSSYRKHSILQISNRRYGPLFESKGTVALARRRPPESTEFFGLVTRHLSLTTAFLIANARLELSLSHRKHSIVEISNRKWMPVFEFQKPLLTGLPNA